MPLFFCQKLSLVQSTQDSRLSKNFQRKRIGNRLFFCRIFSGRFCRNRGFAGTIFRGMPPDKIKCVKRILEMTDGRAEWLAPCRDTQRMRGAFSGSRAAAPPSRVDACVGSYWVLSDAKTGRFGSKAALDLRKNLEEGGQNEAYQAQRQDREEWHLQSQT